MKSIFCRVIILLAAISMFPSCSSYRQNIMFKVPEGAQMKVQADEAQRNYIIQKNDYLKLDVYTNGGELIIDPELKLLKDMPAQTMQIPLDPNFLVDINGVVKFPMIGDVKMEGLSIRQAEAMLQKEYTMFYKDPFVILQYTNKRVVVLGAPGGKVIPLINENVTLVEILALSNAIDNNAMAHNIRILRGDQYEVVDLTTIEGYKKSNMIMQHGDIVYVEPVRRPFVEAGRDYYPIFSLAISITTLIVVLISL